MAGDHKCPVCQSTFTRPQHVARHMRSHTGDRPYKCQHCGDAFARSDLLSRHVNKCHSAEKAAAQAAAEAAGQPIPKGRKGRSNVSTKTACDQCTLAKLSCNFGEPCSKCVSKNIKCTYNQMNTAKAQQQLPSLTLTQTTANARPRTSLDSSFPPLDYSYGPYPSSASQSAYPSSSDPLMSSLSSSLPPHFSFSPNLYPQVDMEPSHQHPSLSFPNDTRSNESSSPNYHYNPYPQGSASSGGGIGSAAREARADLLRRAALSDPSSASELLYQPHSNHSQYASPKHPYLKTGSEYTSPIRTIYNPEINSTSSPDLAGPDSHRLPPTVPSQLPSIPHLTDLPPVPPMQAYTSVPTNALPYINNHSNFMPSNNDGRPQTAGEGGFSSAFGLMSLDDPAVLAGLADPVPFFEAEGQRLTHQRFLPSHSTQAVWETAIKDKDKYRAGAGGDAEYADVRAFWNSFIRTPSDKTVTKKNNDSNIGNFHLQSPSQSLAPSRRANRSASLPATKTPPEFTDNRTQSIAYANGNYARGGQDLAPPKIRAEELAAYQQAILARGTPEFKVDPSSLELRRAKTLKSSISSRRTGLSKYDDSGHHTSPTSRPVLPPGRNAPFIGPSGPVQHHAPSDSSQSSSFQSSPIHRQNQLQLPEAGVLPSHVPSQWDPSSMQQRPQPKRNASQTLEQEMQKSFRPAGAVDISGEYEGFSAGTDDDHSGGANNSPALSASASLSGPSRPGTSQSQKRRPSLPMESNGPPPLHYQGALNLSHPDLPPMTRRMIPEVPPYAGEVP